MTFFNSHFCWLLKIVQNFKDWPIFDQITKEILTETQNENQQIRREFKKLCPILISHNFHHLLWCAIFTIKLFLTLFNYFHNFKLLLSFLLNCINFSLNCKAPMAISDNGSSLFCVPDCFDYHCPVKMGGGDIIFGSISFSAFLKVAMCV